MECNGDSRRLWPCCLPHETATNGPSVVLFAELETWKIKDHTLTLLLESTHGFVERVLQVFIKILIENTQRKFNGIISF